MDKWEIVVVIIALFGFVVAIVKPIAALTKSITTLNCTVSDLKDDMSSFLVKNTEAHRRLWDHNTIQDKKINEHDKDIAFLKGGGHEKVNRQDI